MARSDCDSCCGILQLASNNETFKWAVLNSLCTIATNVADGLQAVTSCLEVTVAGAWGSIGDRIIETRWYDVNPTPPTLVSTLYFNETTRAAVTGVTSGNTAPCPGADIGESCANPIFTNLCDASTPANFGLYAEDAVHVSGNRGQFILGVSNTGFANLSNTDGDYTPIATNLAGAAQVWFAPEALSSADKLKVPYRAEDTAFSNGEPVMIAGGVINTSRSSFSATDQDIAPIALTSQGAVCVTLDASTVISAGNQPVRLEDAAFAASDAVMMGGQVINESLAAFSVTSQDIVPVAAGRAGNAYTTLVYDANLAGGLAPIKLEDSVAASGDAGIPIFGVVNTSITATAANGDYTNLAINAGGALYVDVNFSAQSSSGGANALLKLEDSVHTSGDAGVMVLGVVNEAGTSLSSGANDYSIIATQIGGAVQASLSTNFRSPSSTPYPYKPEDEAFGAGGALMMAGAQRQDVPTTDTDTTGDAAPLKGTAYGEAWTQRGGASFSNILTATTTTVKSGVGILHRIIVNKAVANGVYTIYDNTAASGTKVGTVTQPAAILQSQQVLEYGLRFGTGLTIVTGSTDDITVVYS